MSTESGARLRKLREEKGGTQEQMAQMLGMKSKQAYTAIEGGRELSFENLMKVADYFGVTADYIIGRSPYRTVKEEKLAFEKLPANPHDLGMQCAVKIHETAQILLEKYQLEGQGVQDDYLEPLAKLCILIQRKAKLRTYEGDTVNVYADEWMEGEESLRMYKKASEACQALLKEGF